MIVRNATLEDLDIINQIEATCFPPEEAAPKESFYQRLSIFPNHFWLLEDNGEILAFIDGLVSNEDIIKDEMFENAMYHDVNGNWQTIMGVNTLPRYRRKGYAEILMKQVIADAKSQGRLGCVLTCKEKLISYYSKFGYKNLGLSKSQHGGAVWYDMRLDFLNSCKISPKSCTKN